MDSNGINPCRASPTRWAEIPAELLDKISEYLPKLSDVLPMRMVSKHWNSVINSALEHRIMQQWTVWLPFIKLSNISHYPAIDLSPQMIYTWKKVDADYGSCLIREKDVNPFPNNFLNIHCIPSLLYSLQNRIEEKLNGFLAWHGNNLVSLTLVLTEISPDRFQKTLEQVPNLRAFSIAVMGKVRDLHERVKNTESRTEPLQPSPCSKLEYLRICQGTSVNCELIQWLLKLLAPQLKSLEIDGNELPPFDQEHYPVAGSFQKLKWLKIRYPPNLNFLRSGSAFRWSITNLSIQVLGPVVPMQGLLEFIDNFSGSLSNLYLYIEKFVHVEKPEEFLAKKASCFPKLLTLAVNGVGFRPVFQFVKTNFTPRFRNLKTLQLLDFQLGPSIHYGTWSEMLKKEAIQYCEHEGFWKSFPKLQKIEVYPIQLGMPGKGKFYYLQRTN
ncbi:unnamed protein product [Orchesella dallaii]|uniref:F-box domain-containing protein n=1 Tax=Orchesella dallaii TaxID=48710 RepID=A0ABP1RKI1_9HEXA